VSRHIFISYAHEDNCLAEAVTVALYRSKLAAPFIDKIALGPGDSLTKKLGDGLDDAKALVVLVSKSSMKSDWVHNELKAIQHREIPIIPLRCDDAKWPGQVRLLLGDRIYLDGSTDFQSAVGKVPKLFTETPSRDRGVGFGEFFSLRGYERKAPHLQVFAGTLESFWDEYRFGRTAVVLPTNQSIDLLGRVTRSFLDHVGVDAGSITSTAFSITSSDVAELRVASAKDELVLLASTAFNNKFQPHAADQWAAAQAVLQAAERLRCTLVLVPPMGSGSFDWPVRQGVVNWIYGAIRWASRNPTVTELSTWPVVCVPGPGDQAVLKGYLGGLTGTRRETLTQRQWGLRIRYKDLETEEVRVSDDLLLGAVAKNAIRSLDKSSTWKFVHGKHLFRKSSRQVFEYGPSAPLGQTIFADGDTIELNSD
jgi:hypothetical protein